MRVAVDASVSSDPKWFPILDVILIFIEEERHIIASDAAHSLFGSRWIEERPRDVRDLIRLSSTVRSHDPYADSSVVIIDARCRRGGSVDAVSSTTTLHPLDAILFLSMPFQVIVENEYYDGGFLLWMAKALGFLRFIEAYRKGRFVFRHAGGKDWMPQSAAVFSKGVWPRKQGTYDRAFRFWLCAMLDNDARHPGDNPNEQIVNEVGCHVAFVRVLRKRSIESYIPHGKLIQYDSSFDFRRRVAALNRLSPDQKRYFHMKRGFRGNGVNSLERSVYLMNPAIPLEEKALFESISDADWSLLMAGLGRQLSQIYVDEAYRPNANDVSLTDADDRSELENLLRAIYERI